MWNPSLNPRGRSKLIDTMIIVVQKAFHARGRVARALLALALLALALLALALLALALLPTGR